jgi:hypothetical protein
MLFAFSEKFVAVVVADEFKSRFDQFAGFRFGVGNAGCEVIILEVDQLRVQHCAVE